MSMISVGELMIIVVCGSMIVDAQVNVTMDISTSYFICIDGCNITASWYNDSYCDCSECEDELLWNCTSCGGCPSVCGDSNDCTNDGAATTASAHSSISTTAFATFTCNDGCDIDASYTDDDYCDCSECEDESSWNCTMCGACATVCGDYIDCLASSTVSPSTTTTSASNTSFTCNDGCTISSSWYDDDYCDCSQCEDEPNWNCASCGACPTQCHDYYDCLSNNGTIASDVFTCNDGCDIDASYYNDSYCDCSECEDELMWNCTSCGTCPNVCGDYHDCNEATGTTTTMPTTISDDTDIDTTHDEQTDSSGNNGNGYNTTMADSNENDKANITLIATTGEDINIHQANGAFITMTGSFITIILTVATTLLV